MYIVSYDISDDKERNAVFKKLGNYGERVQKSVWTCDIDYRAIEKLKKELEQMNIESGNIQIWLVKNSVCTIGAEETLPKRSWAHFL